MHPAISVILCTHNPRPDYLSRVLQALRQQTLPVEQWQLRIIDNASDRPLATEIQIPWHPDAQIIREAKLGLTPARLRGFRQSTGNLLVFVDDDNLLEPDYLLQVDHILQQHPSIGAIAGKSLPEFAVEPANWMEEFFSVLALRDFGNIPLITPDSGQAGTPFVYPEFAPVGAGMALRRSAFATYVEQVTQDPHRLALGRSGRQLISGEDNDIVLTLMQAGWRVGYFPDLQLTHLIAAQRLNGRYLAKLNHAASCSWVQVLAMHGMCPWQQIPRWSVTMRQLKAVLKYQPWQDAAAYVRWRGACGLLEGQGALQALSSIQMMG